MRPLGFPRWRRHKSQHEHSTSVPASGTYLTDGASLFRVAGTLIDLDDDPLVELEDCRTLELLLLPVRQASAWAYIPSAPIVSSCATDRSRQVDEAQLGAVAEDARQAYS